MHPNGSTIPTPHLFALLLWDGYYKCSSINASQDDLQVVVDERRIGTLEVQEAALGGGFGPITDLYSELVKVNALSSDKCELALNAARLS